MKEKMLEKIHQLGKIGKVIAVVGKVLLAISTIVCLLVLVLGVRVVGDLEIEYSMKNEIVGHIEDASPMIYEMIESFENQIDILNDFDGDGLDVISYDSTKKEIVATIDAGVLEYEPKQPLVSFGIQGLVSIVVLFFFLIQLEKLCKHFAVCETPFTKESIKYLRNCAYGLLVVVISDAILPSIIDSVLYGYLNLSVNLDVMLCLCTVIFFFLMILFKYGLALEEEKQMQPALALETSHD